MIILGVDPGLTRCGVGVIEAGANRRLSFIHVDVVRSDPHTSQDLRLLTIYNGLCSKMDRFIPDAVSIERVFAQSNRNTVLGTAQAAGMAMLAAAQRGIPVALHTPTEAKLAITGNGKAEKIQIERMVAKVLGLNTLPQPADAADALSLAICHAPARRLAGRRTGTASDRGSTAVGAGGAEGRSTRRRPQRHVMCVEQMFCIMWMGRLDTISRTTCQFGAGAFGMCCRYVMRGERARGGPFRVRFGEERTT